MDSNKTNLWVTFKLSSNYYAVSVDIINAISIIPDNVTPVENGSKYVRGIINEYGNLITLIGLREILMIPTIESEVEAFKEMLNKRKEDHILWVNELKRSVKNGEVFKLAIDPHKCKFGKWYDNFETENHAVRFHMNKIDTPHKKLHKTASQIEECYKIDNKEERNEKINKLLKKASEIYVPSIIELIDSAVDVYESCIREMYISISDMSGKVIGLALDEVVGITELKILSDSEELEKLNRPKFIAGVAKAPDSDEIIMVIDAEEIIELTGVSEISKT